MGIFKKKIYYTGLVCPRCKSTKIKRAGYADNRHQCKKCGKVFS